MLEIIAENRYMRVYEAWFEVGGFAYSTLLAYTQDPLSCGSRGAFSFLPFLVLSSPVVWWTLPSSSIIPSQPSIIATQHSS
jgi:hypothetical protein